MEFSHIPVLLNETIDGLNIKEGGTYVDCTLGGAGHSKVMLQKASILKTIVSKSIVISFGALSFCLPMLILKP